MQALLLPLHSDWYAIDLRAVRGVVRTPRLTPLPGAPQELLGVFNLRGDVIPLFDTAVLLGLARAPGADQLVIAESGRGPAGLLAHGRPHREALGAEAGGAELAAAIGRFTITAGIATLLDLDRLLIASDRRAA